MTAKMINILARLMKADDVSQEPKFTQFMSQRAIADSDAYSCTYPEVQPEKEPEHRRTIAIETKSGNCQKLFRREFRKTYIHSKI